MKNQVSPSASYVMLTLLHPGFLRYCPFRGGGSCECVNFFSFDFQKNNYIFLKILFGKSESKMFAKLCQSVAKVPQSIVKEHQKCLQKCSKNICKSAPKCCKSAPKMFAKVCQSIAKVCQKCFQKCAKVLENGSQKNCLAKVH